MKWYHFGMFFLLIFLTFAIAEHGNRLQIIQSSKIWENDYRCLVPSVDAATKQAFAMGNVTGEEAGKRAIRVYMDTLSLLQGDESFLPAQTDNFWECTAGKQTVCLVLMEKDGFYICSPALGDISFGSKKSFEDGAKGQKQIADAIQDCVLKYVGIQNGAQRKYKSAVAEEGSWERSLGTEGMLAVYASGAQELSAKQGLRFVYAAAKPVEETYLVTRDGKCHRMSCSCVDAATVVQTFSSLLSATDAGAEYCEVCLMWDE